MATRTRRRKKSSVGGKKKSIGSAKTRKIAGKRYTKKACSTTKSGAKKLADRYRKKHKSVRVIDKCIYTYG